MTVLIRYRNETHPARLSSARVIGGEIFVTVTVTDGAWKVSKQLHISCVKRIILKSNSDVKAAA